MRNLFFLLFANNSRSRNKVNVSKIYVKAMNSEVYSEPCQTSISILDGRQGSEYVPGPTIFLRVMLRSSHPEVFCKTSI